MALDFRSSRAHTDADGRVDWLASHARRVGQLAEEFASAFDAGPTARLLGLLHDVGKALPDFQDYLGRLEAGERLRSGPPHAIWGAALWYALGGKRAWQEICLPIAGHHAGLKAASDLSLDMSGLLRRERGVLEGLKGALAASGLLIGASVAPATEAGTGLEMRVRLLLSALADADFLATEEHFKPVVSARRLGWPTIQELWPAFERAHARKELGAKVASRDVQRVRSEIYRGCLQAADLPTGVFRLTAPTGGGKTRSGLAFALKHCVEHPELRRVVLAVPYTSITEQSAGVYQEMLGEGSVLEHHSNMAAVPDVESQDAVAVQARLATENWDAPVIVTTTVQLFESLFARRPAKVRKLHNLARSVILLDEVQTLPSELLRPTLDGLRWLVEKGGSTVVLCTATQPAFGDTPCLREFGGLGVREIVGGCAEHFDALRRVEYEFRPAALSWADIASELRSVDQALVVLNTRRDAMRLLDEVGAQQGLFHLSTLMCGAHRRAVLEEVGRRLPSGERVLLISTQVVECGVDLDFPRVYRAVGPLDRIVQAAGRCNREGSLPGRGRVVVFEPSEGGLPSGPYRVGCEQARLMLGRVPAERLHDPGLYSEYFQRVFESVDLDKRKVQDYRAALGFLEVADRYHFMPDTVPAIVSYRGLDESLVERWRYQPSRQAWRALQPFVVSLYKDEARRYTSEGWLDEVGPGLCRWLGKYDALRGISAEALDPADLIVME